MHSQPMSLSSGLPVSYECPRGHRAAADPGIPGSGLVPRQVWCGRDSGPQPLRHRSSRGRLVWMPLPCCSSSVPFTLLSHLERRTTAKRTSVTAAPPAPGRIGVDVPPMQFQRHDRGIHALRTGGTHTSPVTKACQRHSSTTEPKPSTRRPPMTSARRAAELFSRTASHQSGYRARTTRRRTELAR
jgi:hypothetical protein